MMAHINGATSLVFGKLIRFSFILKKLSIYNYVMEINKIDQSIGEQPLLCIDPKL